MEDFDSKIISLIGGGPASLFMMKHIFEAKLHPKSILIFEKNDRLGVGMPYGKNGSSFEHVANVSANELPPLLSDIEDYLKHNPTTEFPDYFSDGKINRDQVIPRLLLGDYLENQFEAYIRKAKSSGIKIKTLKNTAVLDIVRNSDDSYSISIENDGVFDSDIVVICTGHFWPKTYEGKVKGWYDSPYPPSKFAEATNFPVSIKGASLTAVDAIKTVARLNGKFVPAENDQLQYILNEDSKDFSIDLYSLSGFLPALRFHSDDEAFSQDWTMSLDEIYTYKKSHQGFVDLDYVFEKNFQEPLRSKDPEFHEKIQNLSVEEFSEKMLKIRDELDSFELFKAEFTEAEKSIKRHQSVSWKEALNAFSYSMNYPAKHFSAEDMLRLQKSLLPLISVIIAALPQSSYKELIALYNADIIRIVSVDKKSTVEPHPREGAVYKYTDRKDEKQEKFYQLYIDATGQKALQLNDLPFAGLKENEIVSSGYLNFKNAEEAKKLLENGDDKVKAGENGNYYLAVNGLSINDHFQALDKYGKISQNLYIMAVAFISGLNPDYSGLDFCETASEIIVKSIGDGMQTNAIDH